ncbi:MAG: insulinase family protein [Eubacteriales bacterium]|nr:insulinase family protein [Eubacteriales bacterium]
MNLEECYKVLENLDLDKYELVSLEKLKDINSCGLLLKHKKSGARLAVVSNDDENKVFSIGFRTPPYNDTGLQHILEHSTLCGSRKYPVKDPFVELCKGSLNTFLNAMTYPDKTVYPVASCNNTDFKNIMDVYMDAVFYPNIYDRPQIFKQEGWHYELEDVDDELKINGVVFNEMKGAFSAPDDMLSRYTFLSLFPDTSYRFESGGEPDKIPSLSYEEFLDYHKNYYHPVNSYIYLYGDMDVQERLDYLDTEYLSDFDKADVNTASDIKLQKGFDKLVEKEYAYPVTEDEQLTDNSYISVNYVISDTLDSKLYLAMQVLDYALVCAPGAPVKQALIDAGVGTDIYSDYGTAMIQPVYSIIAKNADKSQKELFKRTIRETLEKIVEDGIDERMIAAGINYYEFKFREADFGSFPKGLMYYLTMMDSWLYDENKPFIHLGALAVFDKLKSAVKEGYFEDIIKRYLLDNTHGSVISLVPEYGLDEHRQAEEREKLAAYKAALSKEELEMLVKDTKELKEYQDTPSKQEELETIPMLKVSDIEKTPQPFYIEPKKIEDVTVIHHNLYTNKIAYMMLMFDCKNVPDELLAYVGLLATVLGGMDTDRFTYPELTNEININCGGISAESSIYTDNPQNNPDNGRGKYTIAVEVKAKMLYEKIPFALEMIEEIIYHTKFEDYKRLKEIIARVKSRIETTMVNSGNTVAMMEAMSQFSETTYYSSLMKGYGYYKVIKEMNDNFEDKKEEIVKNIRTLVRLIFNKKLLTVSFTADNEGYDKLKICAGEFINKLNDYENPLAVRSFKPVHVRTGLTSASQVQYVARCGNYRKAGYNYTGALKVLKVIFSYEYLWLNVRVKGGAYGCMSSFYRNGDMYLVSYRDPNLSKTNEVYEGAADYIKNFTVSDRDMAKFIIGTVGEMDTPMNPAAKGLRSFSAYISNMTYERLCSERLQVLEASQESIRALAPLVEAAMKQNYLCVVGNAKAINNNKEMFDEIKPLNV